MICLPHCEAAYVYLEQKGVKKMLAGVAELSESGQTVTQIETAFLYALFMLADEALALRENSPGVVQ